MKKLITSIAIMTVVVASSTFTFASNDTGDSIDVVVQDKQVDFDKVVNGVSLGKPFVERNKTFLPLRAVSEELGYKVRWDQSSHATVITKGKNTVKIEVDKPYAYVNGVKTNIDVESGIAYDTRVKVVESRTYVPVRFISEALGDQVEYRQPGTSDISNKTVYINSSNIPTEDTPNNITGLPTNAIFSHKDLNYEQYSYNYKLSLMSGGHIERILVDKRWGDTVVYITGLDADNNSYLANYSGNTLSYSYSVPNLTNESKSQIRVEADKFLKAYNN